MRVHAIYQMRITPKVFGLPYVGKQEALVTSDLLHEEPGGALKGCRRHHSLPAGVGLAVCFYCI